MRETDISMDLNAALIRDLLRETITDPQGAARRLVAAAPPMEARWLALALVAVLSVLIGQASALVFARAGAAMVVGLNASAILHGVVLVVVVWAAHTVGRIFGGTGTFADAILLISWLQFVMVMLQLVQLLALVLLPPLSMLIGMAAIALFLWLLTNFVAVLHGFKSLGKVFGMILVTFMALAFVLAFLLALLGIQGPGMVDA